MTVERITPTDTELAEDEAELAAQAERERCATLRAEAIITRAGAQLRAGLYGPSIITDLAIGTVGLMLAKILNGDIEVKDAKQAADVANIALKISDAVSARAEMTNWGAASGKDAVDADSPAGRAAKMAKADEIVALIRKRASETHDQYAADTTAGAVDLSEFDLDDEDDARPGLHVVAS